MVKTVIRRYAAAPVALMVAAGLLTGCNGGGDPKPSPTASSSSASPSVASSSASPSPSPTPSVSIPAEAMAQTPEGAVAFVKFYFEQVNKAWMEPNDSILVPLSDASCNSCKNFQKDAVELKSKGQRMSPEPAAISDLKPTDSAPAGQLFMTATITQTGANVLDGSGAVVDRDQPSSGKYFIATVWKEGRWFLLGVAEAT